MKLLPTTISKERVKTPTSFFTGRCSMQMKNEFDQWNMVSRGLILLQYFLRPTVPIGGSIETCYKSNGDWVKLYTKNTLVDPIYNYWSFVLTNIMLLRIILWGQKTPPKSSVEEKSQQITYSTSKTLNFEFVRSQIIYQKIEFVLVI